MIRYDQNLAFMLQYENVAWFEDGKVRILDRRIYPTEVKFVICESYREVADAIRDMVTQSAGPYTAAGMGMVLAGYEVRNETKEKQIEFLKKASFEISHARPTTANRMSQITENAFKVMLEALDEGKSTSEAAFNATIDSLNRR